MRRKVRYRTVQRGPSRKALIGVMATVSLVRTESGRREPHLKGLRLVASLEFAKGVAVLLLGFGLVLVHGQAWEVAENFLEVLHINPDHRYAQAFLNLADRFSDTKLWVVAATLAAYSVLRFVETYGLWRARAWAEWLAFASGSLYLPFEIYELLRRPSLMHVSILVINVVIVLYMLYLRTWGRSQTRVGRSQ
jgi:uncharacterized membrane protein (DUF2068 family)